MTAAIMTDAKFNFKTEKLRNEKGEVIGEGKKHPSVELKLPVPSRDALAVFLTNPEQYSKELQLLDAALFDVVYRMARQQINDFREKNSEATITEAALNYAGLDWTAIANLPPSSRGSVVPADEDFTAFYQSYIAIMPGVTGKPKDKIENHTAIFSQGFKKQRNNVAILGVLRDALAMYAANADEATVEEHAEVLGYLVARCEKFIAAPVEITLDNV